MFAWTNETNETFIFCVASTIRSSIVTDYFLNNQDKNMFVTSSIDKCVACAVGKSCKLPFSESHSVYASPLELIEMGLWDPAPVTSTGCL